MLSNALSKMSRVLMPKEGMRQVERESVHLAMLEGNVAVVFQASGQAAANTMKDLLDQGTKKIVVVADTEEHKNELLAKLPKEVVDEGRAVGVIDQYQPKEKVEELLARVRKAAGLDEKAGVTSVMEYESSAETYASW
ncbi:hypothetical protein BASA81_000802 [Batrachochytrium salamandrivorans]|nr:hypothetical protein BASA81_000802 [Batrachochytrium salamandrivorans]